MSRVVFAVMWLAHFLPLRMIAAIGNAVGAILYWPIPERRRVTRILPAGRGYVARLYPAWTDFPSGDDAADARRMLAFIEERVLEMPEQYFWLHKRFKTRPEGEARFY